MKHTKAAASIVLVALLIHSAIYFYPRASTHSAIYNYIWTLQFAEAFLQGDFYPRWFSGSFDGLGSPTFYFYPPLAFWISGGFASFGVDPMVACAIAATLFGAASGLAMYAWLVGRTPHALMGAVAYMFAPYHLVDLYVRGALAEYASFIWAPLLMLAIDRLPQRRALMLLSVSYAGLILTHIPAALLTTLLLVLPYGIYRGLQDRKKLLAGGLAGVIGIGLASFYLVPALTLQDHVSIEVLWSDSYRPTDWFVWNRRDLPYVVSFPALALALMICGLSVRSFWGATTAIAGASILGLIPFIWEVELLARVQFPWRLLGPGEFALISAVALATRVRMGLLRLGFVLGFIPAAVFLILIIETMRISPAFEQAEKTRTDAIEYLPHGLTGTGVTEQQRKPNLGAYKQLPRGKRILIDMPGRVTLGHASFPIWEVVHNGDVIPHSGPLITFNAPRPGIYTVQRKTVTQEVIGWLTTTLAMLMLFVIWLMGSTAARIRIKRLFPARRAEVSPTGRHDQPSSDDWNSYRVL